MSRPLLKSAHHRTVGGLAGRGDRLCEGYTRIEPANIQLIQGGSATSMTHPQQNGARKPPIIGQPHALDDEEAQSITEMILEVQGSSRQLTIPAEDLDAQATTQMDAPTARVIDESHVRDILQKFNRDYL